MFGLLDRGLWTLFPWPFIISLIKNSFHRIVGMVLEIFSKTNTVSACFPVRRGIREPPLMVPELHSKKINIFNNEFS